MRYKISVPGGNGVQVEVEAVSELFGFTDAEVYALAQVGESVRFVKTPPEPVGAVGQPVPRTAPVRFYIDAPNGSGAQVQIETTPAMWPRPDAELYALAQAGDGVWFVEEEQEPIVPALVEQMMEEAVA